MRLTQSARRLIALSLGLSLLAGPLAVPAEQPAGKTARIGLLGDVDPVLDRAFRQGLRELGYVEGANVTIERRESGWNYDRLPALAAELVRLPVDVIVAASPPATEAARRATSAIPIVFTVAADPVAEGFVASLARPGGNVTGLATVGSDLVGKQLEILKTVAPKVSRIAILLNPSQRGHRLSLPRAQDAARALGVELQVLEAGSPSAIDAAFAAMKNKRAGGLLVLRDAMFRAQRAQIVGLAARLRLPAVYGLREQAEAGGLIAYGANVPEMYRRAATYVDKVLKGAKPADLPVEQPTTFELVVNTRTARALGLTIPPSLLAQADQVIE